MPGDKAVMQQIQNGKLHALADLFEQNHVALYHYFLRMGNCPAVSEDLVQETFMKVIMYQDSLHNIESFRAWLYGIARNTSADYYRKHQRTPVSTDPAKLDGETEMPLQEEMEREQQHDLFAAALQQLPSELRDILVLHRYQQLQYDEIASLLNCNLNTLKSKMRKAVSELHKHYSTLAGETNL